MNSTATRLLKSALVALANISAVRAAVSSADLAEFPEFAALMASAGGNLDWKSYKVTAADGYITTMWHITGDNNSPAASPRGPVLLEHGWWSDGTGWMERSDATSNAFPTKLHELGFDVWISNARGTNGSMGHVTKDMNLDDTYFDYCFVEEAMNDLPAQVDTILAARAGQPCSKVALLTHSTGANTALYSTCENPIMQEKVSRIVNLAPCFFLNTSYLELRLEDPPSFSFFTDLFETYGIKTLFGPKFATDVQNTICQEAIYADLCPFLLLLNDEMAEYVGNQTTKQFEHLVQIAVQNRWQQYIASPSLYPNVQRESDLIPVDIMASPGVYTLFAGADERCPYQTNDVFTKSILSYADSTNVMGANHMGFLGANDLSFMSILEPMLPLLGDPIVNTLTYCPAEIDKKSSKKGSSRSGSSKKSRSKSGSSKKSRSKSGSSSSKSASKKNGTNERSSSKSKKSNKSKRSSSKGSRSGSKDSSKKSSKKGKKDKKGKKSRKPTKFTIGFKQDDNVAVPNFDSINLNDFNVDFDADDTDAGYQSEEVELKSVSQLQGVYTSNGRFNGDDRRAERRSRQRNRTQLNYLTQLKAPMPDLND